MLPPEMEYLEGQSEDFDKDKLIMQLIDAYKNNIRSLAAPGNACPVCGRRNYLKLINLRDNLSAKTDKTKEEEELLTELISLNYIINNHHFLLSASGTNCPTCGQALK